MIFRVFFLKKDDELEDMGALLKKLFPICRSITGNGVRETLKIISNYLPLEIKEIPSGTKVYDWTVPKEWNITDAYIKNSNGEKIVDFKKCNLHVLNYSTPVKRKMKLDELKSHLFTLPDQPEIIPYRTSYYKEDWGFCISHKQFLSLKDGEYEVVIDSTLSDGHLTYGEYFIKGEIEDEVLLSTYLCHPSLYNDNLSGVILLTFLAKTMAGKKPKHSYRFIFIPETIGAIVWLNQNEDRVGKIKYGLVATCVGDKGKLTYKKTKYGDCKIDEIVEKVLVDSGRPYLILDFFPTGSDERQFCSPGFNMPVGSLMRTPYTRFPEYHNSADNLSFASVESLQDTLERYLEIIYVIENNAVCINLNPKCEPQLGKHGLYGSIGGKNWSSDILNSIMWVLSFSDGKNSLLDISIRSKLNFKKIKEAANALEDKKLLKKLD